MDDQPTVKVPHASRRTVASIQSTTVAYGWTTRMSSPSRWPRLFPPRIYELTHGMLEHAVHAELADLAIIQLTSTRTSPA
jgi:hypothetical protein